MLKLYRGISTVAAAVPGRLIVALDGPDIKKGLDGLIKSNPVFMASKSYCPYCSRAKTILDLLRVEYAYIELDHMIPSVFIGTRHVGGSSDLAQLSEDDKLRGLLEKAGARFLPAQSKI
ncbi:uncharacterized protein SAPINGB_P006139 [Magnusiomyces paraingens]|uniref:Glutaredoxin domain-containing protein n=1 Tax=Magnusiomyces paraingens TaxID=2606893 RepID=A0A5E8C3H1_9ASCO|nr:uncharacterized protein SAPINGB_P006139 [Saprochaete ingens]VVT58304.1 unnamed protein product [Saprochaete ingens]